jgi:hypothetical protein
MDLWPIFVVIWALGALWMWRSEPDDEPANPPGIDRGPNSYEPRR